MDELIKQMVDQPLHFLWTFTALCVIVRDQSIKSFVLAAMIFALPRELVDQWPVGNLWDMLLDMTFFMLGGLAAGILWKRKNTTRV